VSFLGNVEGIFDPGGDPEAVRGAARATRALASELRGTVSALDPVAADLKQFWRGAGAHQEGSAADNFQRAWGKFSKDVLECAEQLDEAATRIDKIAGAIATAQAEAARLKQVIELTIAGGALLTFFSFGVSDATADVMAATDIAVAAGVMTEVDGFIANSVALLSDVTAALAKVAAQFMLGVISDGLAIMAFKPFEGENPFSLSSYDANDVSNVLLGGLVSGALGVVVNGVTPVSEFMQAHPVAGAALWNATSAFSWGVPWEFWVLGQPFDLHTWQILGESTGISFVSASVLGKAGTTDTPLGRLLSAEGETGLPGVTRADVSNNGFILPITGIKYLINGGPQPTRLLAPDTGPTLPPAPGVAAPNVPELPPGTPVRLVPPHIGGGTQTVAPGDSLWDIARRRLGNPSLYPVIASANPQAVGPDGTIVAGQVLRIPVLPPLPPGATAQVVQPGQSISEIAGGNTELARRIAELSDVQEPSLIYPGQVLIIPPAG